MLPCTIVFGHSKYISCLPIYLNEMQKLPETAPEVHEEFAAGKFTVHQTAGDFNGVWTDLALEQTYNNTSHKKPIYCRQLLPDVDDFKYMISSEYLPEINSAAYADDTLIYVSDLSPTLDCAYMNGTLVVAEEWAKNWDPTNQLCGSWNTPSIDKPTYLEDAQKCVKQYLLETDQSTWLQLSWMCYHASMYYNTTKSTALNNFFCNIETTGTIAQTERWHAEISKQSGVELSNQESTSDSSVLNQFTTKTELSSEIASSNSALDLLARAVQQAGLLPLQVEVFDGKPENSNDWLNLFENVIETRTNKPIERFIYLKQFLHPSGKILISGLNSTQYDEAKF
ncbi:hypothetical protein GQR58_015406 [Nymphon striatum]|nr:hypothetical protein GQR58_015406 [Nymphon striatum]